MEKDLDRHREDLLLINQIIEAVANFMKRISPDDLDGSGKVIRCDLEIVLEKESDKIYEIIGRYDEAFPITTKEDEQ